MDVVDHYGVPFHFRLDNGQREHSSYMGALLTFAAIASSMIYCYFKLVTWSQKPDVDLTSALQKNAFGQDDRFGIADGFFFTAALTGYEANNEGVIGDEKYGQLVIH